MSEADESKRDGARLQPNSGRGPIAKGDAIWCGYVVDYKEYGKTFGLSKSMWSKVCTDTFAVGLEYNPALKVVLGSKNKVRLAVIEWEHFKELVEKAGRYDDLCR